MTAPAAEASPVKALATEFIGQIQAHYPLIGVRTGEELRTERLFDHISRQTRRHLIRWTTAGGFSLLRAEADTAPNGPVQTNDPLRMLEEIDRGPDSTIYLLEDYGPYLEKPEIRRTVRDLIPRLKAAHAQGIVEYPLNKIVL